MKTVKFKSVAKFYFILTSIIFIVGSCSQPSSNETDGEKTAIKTEIENEILGVYALFRNTIPLDGEFDSFDYGNESTFYKIEYMEVKEDKAIFYCYDTEYLIKMEVIAYIRNAHILYKSPNGEMISLFEGGDINGQFVIIPNSSNSHLCGGTIIIKSADKVLREIIINYEGCL